MILKPCPFCGGNANLRWGHSRLGYYGYARCEDCLASTKLYNIQDELTDKYFHDKDNGIDDEFWESEAFISATRAWNRRANTKKV